MVGQGLLIGAKAIAEWLGASERWFYVQLRRSERLRRSIRKDESGRLFAFEHELREYLEDQPTLACRSMQESA